MPGNQSGLRRVWSHDEAEKYDMDAGEQDSDESVEAHCAPEDAPDDPEETETEVAVEVVFAEDVLESFRGTDEVLAGCLESSVLLGMTATGWEDEVEPDMHDFLIRISLLIMLNMNNFEVYCGQKQQTSDTHKADMKSGPAAVVRIWFAHSALGGTLFRIEQPLITRISETVN
ncbi:hypothetical protein PC118_g6384 [Phytophthora cactorum]|uniref:Uncharacterized protein n=1 Tax=Phytophthora cactorum TaxID=29920 RepID=A0A8T1G5Y7_9STRA|nr:hypothetical protein PC118_g6384 [Phytophthora cactorum]